jgi:hypothetical protein
VIRYTCVSSCGELLTGRGPSSESRKTLPSCRATLNAQVRFTAALPRKHRVEWTLRYSRIEWIKSRKNYNVDEVSCDDVICFVFIPWAHPVPTCFSLHLFRFPSQNSILISVSLTILFF